jgi:hypothetical protein
MKTLATKTERHWDYVLMLRDLQTLARAVFISVALVVGVIGPVIILQRQQERV